MKIKLTRDKMVKLRGWEVPKLIGVALITIAQKSRTRWVGLLIGPVRRHSPETGSLVDKRRRKAHEQCCVILGDSHKP